MNEQLFISKFTEQLEGYEGDAINLDTDFRSIDVWDSLTGIAVQVMINDDFSAAIPDAEFAAAKKVGDLFALMNRYKA